MKMLMVLWCYMKASSRLQKGFTIVELIIVIIVIGILAAVVAVGYNGIQQSARDKSLLSDIDGVEAELARYAVQNSGKYDSDLDWDSSVGTNSNIRFTPSSGNVLVVIASGQDYCIRAYNPKSNFKTLETARKKGTCVMRWASVDPGPYEHTCGVLTTGKAYCWGTNTSPGVFGNGASGNSLLVPSPVTDTGVMAGKKVSTIGTGYYFGCALTTDGLLYCWGSGSSGKLGNGGTASSAVPVAVTMSGALAGKTAKTLTLGDDHACVLASDDLAYCWGYAGTLGNGTTGSSSLPVAVTMAGALAGKTFKQVTSSSAYAHTCAIASDNLGYCWGQNGNGQLGNSSTAAATSPVAVNTSGALAGKTLQSIATGGFLTCAIASDGLPYCWGRNGYYGQLGNNSTADSSVPVAVNTSGVLAGKTIRKMALGGSHTCVIASDAKVYCWGIGTSGQLGNGSTAQTLVPVAVDTTGVLAGKTMVDVYAGGSMSCARDSDGELYCWGDDWYGQLGDGLSEVQPSRPVHIPGMDI